jgi:hypothetical protein
MCMQISNKGSPPSPRCGASMVTYKNKGLYFGGVFDSEGPRHSILSMFYNDLYAFDFERKRWYALGLKVPKINGGNKEESRLRRKEKTREREGKGDEEEGDEDEGSVDSEEEEGAAEGVHDEEDALEKAHQNGNFFGYIDNDGNVVYINIDDLPDDEEDEDEGGVGRGVGEGEIEIERGEGVSVGVEDVCVEEALAAVSLSDTSTAPTLTCTNAPPSSSEELSAAAAAGGESKGADWDKEESADLTTDDTQTEHVDSSHHISSHHPHHHHSEQAIPAAAAAPVDSNPLRRFFSEHRSCPVGRINAGLATKGSTLLVYGEYTVRGGLFSIVLISVIAKLYSQCVFICTCMCCSL